MHVLALVLAMTDVGYLAFAYITTAVALIAYAVWMIHRTRKLSRELPEEERRWG
jgi:hypothetical protein